MSFISKYYNIRSLTIVLVISILLSIISSNNPRASLFYGNLIDHNFVIYLFVGMLLYTINSVWRKQYDRTRIVMFSIPIISTVLSLFLLFSDTFKRTMSWGYFSAISVFSIVAAIVLFIKCKSIWKKILAAVLLAVSITVALSGEMSMYTPKPVETHLIGKFFNFYGISYNDLRPNLSASWILAQQSFIENKMLGVGPNQFANVWMKYRPASSITDQYYNSNIDNAGSSIFKLLIELGIAAFILILIALAKVVSLFQEARRMKGLIAKNNLLHILYILIGSIMILFISNDISFLIYYVALLYLPSNAGADNNANKYIKYILYFIIMLSLALMIAKYISYRTIDRALLSYDTDKNAQVLLSRIDKANKLYPNNFVNSLKSRLYLQQASDLYLSVTDDKRDQKLLDEFKSIIDKAIAEATLSVGKNISNPYVYINRANVYEVASLVNAPLYYDLATQDYNKAIALDPYNPDHMLSLSKLEYAKGMKDKTGTLIDKILSIKPNHLPAYLALADMMERENDRNKKAFVLQEALKANPGNQNVAYMLAAEYYKLELYDDCVLVMKELVNLNPNIEQLKVELKQAEEMASKPKDSKKDIDKKDDENKANKEDK